MQGTVTKCCLILFVCWLYAQPTFSQGGPIPTLRELLESAEKNYPLLKSKLMEVEAAKKGIETIKKTIVPSLDASYQVDYATYNNITGMFYPQYILPMTGP